jgi:hypothetical protein
VVDIGRSIEEVDVRSRRNDRGEGIDDLAAPASWGHSTSFAIAPV